MKPIILTLKLILASFLLLAGVVPVHADDYESQYGDLALAMAIPDRYSEEQVGSALEMAFRNREWIVVEHEDNKVTGRIAHRGIDAIVTAVYSQREVHFYCDATKTKKVRNRATDMTRIVNYPTVPIRWIRNLEADVKDFLGIP